MAMRATGGATLGTGPPALAAVASTCATVVVGALNPDLVIGTNMPTPFLLAALPSNLSLLAVLVLDFERSLFSSSVRVSSMNPKKTVKGLRSVVIVKSPRFVRLMNDSRRRSNTAFADGAYAIC